MPSTESGIQGTFTPKAAESAIDSAFKQLAERFDDQYGGFSSAPKFPRVSEINLALLKHHIAAGMGDTDDAGWKSHHTFPYLLCTRSERQWSGLEAWGNANMALLCTRLGVSSGAHYMVW